MNAEQIYREKFGERGLPACASMTRRLKKIGNEETRSQIKRIMTVAYRPELADSKAELALLVLHRLGQLLDLAEFDEAERLAYEREMANPPGPDVDDADVGDIF